MAKLTATNQSAWIKWVQEQGSQEWCHGVLSVENKRGRLTLDDALLRNTLNITLGRLDQAVFGNAHRRYGKSVLRLCAYGGDVETSVRFHYHLLLAKPTFLSLDAFEGALRREWEFGIANWLTRHLWCLPEDEAVGLRGATWLARCDGDANKLTAYVLRNEGSTFEAGQRKVDVENSFLLQVGS